MLTQEKLKQLLHYNPDTGVFSWLVSRGNVVKAGDIAGWINKGYRMIKINGKNYSSHRLAWLYITGAFPEDQIDHVKHNKTDNRFTKLREATNQENSKNCSKSKNNVSGVTGVSWNKRDKTWSAMIGVNKKTTYLGSSKDKFEVICARKSADNKYGFHPNHGQQ